MASKEKVLRVSQLDVLELDEELAQTFESKIFSIMQSLPSYGLFIWIKPEIKAIVRIFIWGISIRRCGYTFGQEMMQLKYSSSSNDTKQPTLVTKYLLLLNVLLRWMDDRFDDILGLFPFSSSLNTEWLKSVVVSAFRFMQCVNMCSFLLNGIYPSLMERLLRLKMVSIVPQTLRQPSYDFMNREIIWYGFSELIFFVLPMINFFALRNNFRKVLKYVGILQRSPTSENISPPSYMCSYCKSMYPVLPQTAADCGHIYCYYCISANLMADSDYPCNVCGETVQGFTPLH